MFLRKNKKHKKRFIYLWILQSLFAIAEQLAVSSCAHKIIAK